HSGEDVFRWRSLIERVEHDEPPDEEVLAARREFLWHMQNLASRLECRHRALCRYFGQAYEADNCGACDVCLGEVQGMSESTVTAQQILSCVARVDQRFGVGHIVRVLRGAASEQVIRWGHDRLSTYGLLRGMSERKVTSLVYQLADQGLLERTEGDRPVVQLNQESARVLRGERPVQLVDPEQGTVRRARAADESWEGVDRGLFEHLRALRRRLAAERGVPAYVIFGDATLRELARARPTALGAMAGLRGVGVKKLADLGPVFTEAIRSYVADPNE
ncbi:MAG: RQC domain-containing protein, partial [Planctomycetota bacterium]